MPTGKLQGLYIRKAVGDLNTARNMRNPELFTQDAFGFHLQQAVEKSLKAWSLLLGGSAPRIHDLRQLMLNLEKLGIDVDRYWALVELTPYGVQLRYEEDVQTTLDRESVFTLAESLVKDVASVVEKSE